MSKQKAFIKDTILSLVILGVCLGVSLGIDTVVAAYFLVPAVFSLGVFLISYFTEGYVYGIFSSFISVMAINYAFTFPYFKFNFSIAENMVSAMIMLFITIMTSALTTKLKYVEKLKIESEKEKMRANLLRAVSHDLRTPLTTIYGSSSAIVENYKGLSEEQVLKLAGGIKEDAEWLIGMVENLLSVTRVEEGSVELKKELVMLEELIDSVLVRFKRKFPNQRIEIEIPDEFMFIPMDSMLITQVLMNLLENAVRHAVGMTKLLLKVSVQGEYAVFEVIDNGCGISEEQLKHIFMGYYEKKNAPVDHQKRCMGIGLSVCASIIKAHDGEIMAENLEAGGCVFRFLLKKEEDLDEQ